jgi:hypothetical protein
MPRRKTIPIRQKIQLASIVRRLRANPGMGPTLKGLAKARGVETCQLRKWERQLDSLIQLPNQATRSALNSGRPSILAPIKDELLLWLSNARQDGVPISIRMLTIRAIELMPSFAEKSSHAKYLAVHRLMKANGFSIRSKTHVAQNSSEAVRELASQFMSHIRPLMALEDRDKKWILNMDQTAVFFSMMLRTTIHKKGSKTVTMRDTKNGDSRVTVAVSITADGEVLKPFVVMKGKLLCNNLLFFVFFVHF